MVAIYVSARARTFKSMQMEKAKKLRIVKSKIVSAYDV